MLRNHTKKVLNKHKINLSKKKGQSQIVNEKILKKIINHANISEKDVILEIGAGIGNLTELLIPKSKKVIAVENDDRLVKILKERFSNEKKLEIIPKDVLELELPKFNKVVSNLPYYISSKITFKILEQEFNLGILTYQKEFADRMVAEPGSSDYSRLTVNLYYKTKVELLEEIPPSDFIPKPKVKSTIVKLTPRKKPPFEVRNEEMFSRITKAAFQHRRQKLRNALYHSFNVISKNSSIPKKEKRKIIDENIPENFTESRPGKLTPEDYGKITNILTKVLVKNSSHN